MGSKSLGYENMRKYERETRSLVRSLATKIKWKFYYKIVVRKIGRHVKRHCGFAVKGPRLKVLTRVRDSKKGVE